MYSSRPIFVQMLLIFLIFMLIFSLTATGARPGFFLGPLSFVLVGKLFGHGGI